jgi:hypothetical protein
LTFKIELIKGVYKAMNILNKIENKDRGVNDFNSDIQQTVQSKASLFKNE